MPRAATIAPALLVLAGTSLDSATDNCPSPRSRMPTIPIVCSTSRRRAVS